MFSYTPDIHYSTEQQYSKELHNRKQYIATHMEEGRGERRRRRITVEGQTSRT